MDTCRSSIKKRPPTPETPLTSAASSLEITQDQRQVDMCVPSKRCRKSNPLSTSPEVAPKSRIRMRQVATNKPPPSKKTIPPKTQQCFDDYTRELDRTQLAEKERILLDNTQTTEDIKRTGCAIISHALTLRPMHGTEHTDTIKKEIHQCINQLEARLNDKQKIRQHRLNMIIEQQQGDFNRWKKKRRKEPHLSRQALTMAISMEKLETCAQKVLTAEEHMHTAILSHLKKVTVSLFTHSDYSASSINNWTQVTKKSLKKILEKQLKTVFNRLEEKQRAEKKALKKDKKAHYR